MNRIQIIRNPRMSHGLMLQVDGVAIPTGPIELVSKGKDFTTLQVTFFQFDFLGEAFPGAMTISREHLAIDTAEDHGLISSEEAMRQRIELASRS